MSQTLTQRQALQRASRKLYCRPELGSSVRQPLHLELPIRRARRPRFNLKLALAVALYVIALWSLFA